MSPLNIDRVEILKCSEVIIHGAFKLSTQCLATTHGNFNGVLHQPRRPIYSREFREFIRYTKQLYIPFRRCGIYIKAHFCSRRTTIRNRPTAFRKLISIYIVYISLRPRGIWSAISNLHKDGVVDTRETNTRREEAMCLCFHERNLQCVRLNMSFPDFKSMVDNPSPQLSGANYQSHTARQSVFKCIKGACRRRRIWLESNSGVIEELSPPLKELFCGYENRWTQLVRPR